MTNKTFIVDCPTCKAKVAAEVCGIAEDSGNDYEMREPYADRLYVGKCIHCSTLIAGKSKQIYFVETGAEFDEWSDVIRVYPEPVKAFASYSIPKVVTSSLTEGDRSLQCGAPTAACVMFGRALEAVCRDILNQKNTGRAGKTVLPAKTKKSPPTKKIMLGQGIKEMKDQNIIDQRLYDWSQQLQAFRNIAAHPDELEISAEDAEDLRSFVYAIVEYIYDLTEKYEDFKRRIERRNKKK
jgi:hypothetical protein